MHQAWRDLVKIVKWQIWGAVVCAGLVFCFADARAAFAVSIGSVVLISGTLMSARIGLKPASSPEASVVRILAAISWKWLWVFAGLVAAIAKLKLPEVGLVAGIIAAQLLGIFAGMQDASKN
jgi:hypothetical protein